VFKRLILSAAVCISSVFRVDICDFGAWEPQ
jgi:hypothetical protein